MIQKNVEKRVKEIIVKKLGTSLDKISLESRLRHDLGADSLDVVELLMGFEEEFGIAIEDKEAEKIVTVQCAITFIHNFHESKKENEKRKSETESTSSSAT